MRECADVCDRHRRHLTAVQWAGLNLIIYSRLTVA